MFNLLLLLWLWLCLMLIEIFSGLYNLYLCDSFISIGASLSLQIVIYFSYFITFLSSNVFFMALAYSLYYRLIRSFMYTPAQCLYLLYWLHIMAFSYSHWHFLHMALSYCSCCNFLSVSYSPIIHIERTWRGLILLFV